MSFDAARCGVSMRFGPRHWHEECGVFGVWGCENAAEITYFGLHALQHRGQESAGIVSVDSEGECHQHHGLGLVGNVFSPRELAALPGQAAIGHVRYSTTGANTLANAQPIVFESQHTHVALAHNGNLVNALTLRDYLECQGSVFRSTSDTEVVVHLVPRFEYPLIDECIQASLRMLKGAFAFAFLTPEKLMAARDPHGLRPLVLGRLGEGWIIASETCALDAVGATFVRDVEPGELLAIDGAGVSSRRFAAGMSPSLCTFEYIYFARPDSTLDGRNVYTARKEIGKRLAEEAPAEADIVLGVPDSSLAAAIGYAEASGIPYEMGIIKNQHSGRTFIQPAPALREAGVQLKLHAVREVLRGKRVVIVDDSLVRGTTSRQVVQLLRRAGAREIHMRIASPPVKYPCFYGIDTSAQGELVAAQLSVSEICALIGADSLAYVSEAGMLQALGAHAFPHGFCNACFTGRYPTEVYGGIRKDALEVCAK